MTAAADEYSLVVKFKVEAESGREVGKESFLSACVPGSSEEGMETWSVVRSGLWGVWFIAEVSGNEVIVCSLSKEVVMG